MLELSVYGIATIGVAVLCVVGWVLQSIRIVSAGDTLVYQYLGRIQPALGEGVHFVPALLTGKAITVSSKVTCYDPEPFVTMSADNIEITVDIVYSYRIIDASAFMLRHADPIDYMHDGVMSYLRAACTQRTAEKLGSDTRWVSEYIRDNMTAALATYGIELHEIRVETVRQPAALVRAAQMNVIAEREANAAIATSRKQLESYTQQVHLERAKQEYKLGAELTEHKALMEKGSIEHKALMEKGRIEHNAKMEKDRVEREQEIRLSEVSANTEAKRWASLRGALGDTGLRYYLEHLTWGLRQSGTRTTIVTGPTLLTPQPMFHLPAPDDEYEGA